VLSLQERLAAARAAAEAAQRQSTEARLALLQSQLEPHMLFNTLANLRVLIGLDPPRAQQMLDRLIAFLRTTLAASQASMHPLAREFEWLDDYLALMKVRMGERLAVHLALPADLAALPVPPLLLQPLVENAVRHGIEPRPGPCRIEVSAERDGDRLRLVVRDTGVGLARAEAPRPGGGFGLRQVRERLTTLYGARATLRLEEAEGPEGGTLAALSLPLQPPPQDATPLPAEMPR
jgi:sensor histidine kinase YesM